MHTPRSPAATDITGFWLDLIEAADPDMTIAEFCNTYALGRSLRAQRHVAAIWRQSDLDRCPVCNGHEFDADLVEGQDGMICTDCESVGLTTAPALEAVTCG